MSTVVEYNGVVMRGVMTREYDAEATWDASGTDIIGQKIRFTFQGMIHDQGLSTQAVEFQGAAPRWVPSKVEYYRRLLMTARLPLIIRKHNTTNNNALEREFVCNEARPNNIGDPNTDINNGPRPISANVIHVTGDRVFRVTFVIECMQGTCAGPYEATKGSNKVCNNRWAVSESMDANYYVTRTIRGRIRLSSGLWSPHMFKGLVVPKLEPNFARTAIEYDALETGLEATYTVTDRQVTYAAPYPCTQFSARHEETTEDCLQFTSSMSVTCWGDLSTNKVDLLSRAFQIADARLDFLNRKNALNFLIEYASIVDEMNQNENRVDLSIRLRRFDTNLAGYFSNLMTGKIGQPLKLPNYDASVSRTPAVWGYTSSGTRDVDAVSQFFSYCYLQDPCAATKSVSGGEPLKERRNDYVPETTERKAYSTKQLPPTDDAYNFSGEHSKAIYVSARATSVYGTDSRRAHLSLAWSNTKDTAKSVLLGGGRATRTITVDCERIGAWPSIPTAKDEYKDGDMTGKLLKAWKEPMPATLSPDGRTKIYRIRAFYKYGLNRPPTKKETLRVGVLPFTSFTQQENQLPANIESDKFGP